MSQRATELRTHPLLTPPRFVPLRLIHASALLAPLLALVKDCDWSTGLPCVDRQPSNTLAHEQKLCKLRPFYSPAEAPRRAFAIAFILARWCVRQAGMCVCVCGRAREKREIDSD